MQKKLIIPALIAGFVISIAVNAFAYSHDVAEISDCVLRLHVIANSDSEADQIIKLKVRDAVLKYSNIDDTYQSKEEYVRGVQENISDIERTARDTLRELGCEDDVYAEVAKTYFPTKKYGEVTLPAGEYDALRIVIGEGKGRNWWCVMFPPLCSNAVKESEAIEYLEKNLDKGTFMMVTDEKSDIKYEMRLKIVDIVNEWCEK